MDLLCPNCQKRLTVAEQNAGQLMRCVHCSKYFSVPALPQGVAANAGAAVPSRAALQAAPGSPSLATASLISAEPDVFELAPEPPAPQRLPPRQHKEIAMASAAPMLQQSTKEMPLPKPPAGYEHTFLVSVSPRVIRWIAPGALFLVLLFQFSPWTGVYPGGYGVYTQSAFQMIWGGYSVSSVGEKVMLMEKAIDGTIRANWLMLFYFVLTLAALILAATPLVFAQISCPPPPVIEQLGPRRTVLVVVATLIALFILLSFLVSGSGFENAVIAIVEKRPEKEVAIATTAEQSEQQQIELGLKMSRLNLSRTFWLHAVAFFHVIALAGAGLELWTESRGTRPLPRLQVQW